MGGGGDPTLCHSGLPPRVNLVFSGVLTNKTSYGYQIYMLLVTEYHLVCHKWYD